MNCVVCKEPIDETFYQDDRQANYCEDCAEPALWEELNKNPKKLLEFYGEHTELLLEFIDTMKDWHSNEVRDYFLETKRTEDYLDDSDFSYEERKGA